MVKKSSPGALQKWKKVLIPDDGIADVSGYFAYKYVIIHQLLQFSGLISFEVLEGGINVTRLDDTDKTVNELIEEEDREVQVRCSLDAEAAATYS